VTDVRNLPPFPVDDSALDLLLSGVTIQDGAERTSLHETLEMLSMLGGSDPNNIESEGFMESPLGDGTMVPYTELADPFYSVNDAIVALVTEIHRLRA
jgi:hypothetical protein